MRSLTRLARAMGLGVALATAANHTPTDWKHTAERWWQRTRHQFTSWQIAVTERDFANTEEQRRADAKLLEDVLQMSGAAPQEVTALQPVLENMLKSNDAKLAELRDALDAPRRKQTDTSRALLKATEADYYATISP